jgi:protocatechuate 3,4-dioxygenase beta subunit
LEFRRNFQPQKTPVIVIPSYTVLPGAVLSGKVSEGPTGKPAADISILAQNVAGSGYALTDAEGRYTIRRLRPGRYTLLASLNWEQAKHWVRVKRENIDIGKGVVVQGIDLTLISGAMLSGKVSGEDGTPLEGVTVGVHDDNEYYGMMKTGKDGRYLLHIPAGQHKAYIAGGGLSTVEYLLQGNREEEFSVKDGETATVNFVLPKTKAKPIHGRVLGPDGKPVPKANIEAVPLDENDYMAGTQSAVSDANGEFTMEPQAVKLQARCGKLATPDPLPLPNGGEVTLHLEAIAFGTAVGHLAAGPFIRKI